MDEITLSANIQKLSKRMSLRKLSKETGIPATTLSNWQNGQMPSGSAGYAGLRKLSVYLNCTLETLLHGDIDVPPINQHSLADFIQGDVFSGRFLIDLKVKKLPDNN